MSIALSGLLLAALSYLIGSVSFALLTARLFNLADPRSFGSGNPGATNMLRTGNKAAAALTLLGDALKGYAAGGLASFFLLSHPQGLIWIAICAAAVFFGHVYSVFLGFKGGKGVATAAGVMLALNPLAGLLVIAVWLLAAFISRYSSVGALTAAISAPWLYAAVSSWRHQFAWPYLLCIMLLSVCLLYNHRGNIKNLRQGTESKIGQKK